MKESQRAVRERETEIRVRETKRESKRARDE